MNIKNKMSEVLIKIEKVKLILEERMEKCILISELQEEKQATIEAFNRITLKAPIQKIA